MVYELLELTLKQQLFVVHKERLENPQSSQIVERYVAKHPKLKPEMIIINDQVHGFKSIDPEFESLEDFPIYVEIESAEDEEGTLVVESIDLYSEALKSSRDSLSELIYLANANCRTVSLDRVRRMNEPNKESLMIYSKIGDLFLDGYLEYDVEEGVKTLDEVQGELDTYLSSFTGFVKSVNDILMKGKTPKRKPYSNRT